MFDPLPEDPRPPETEARAPVAPPVQGTAPAWDDAAGSAAPTHEQLVLEARARQALREAALRGETPAEKPFESKTGAGFTVERGGRNAMAETAGKIGTAVGSAQREVRRRLELVRHPARAVEFPSASELADTSARMMREIDTEVAGVRKQAARKLEDWSGQAEERFQQFRRDSQQVLRRSGRRAQEFAETYPLQTIAAVAGTFFLVGVALRLGRSRRG